MKEQNNYVSKKEYEDFKKEINETIKANQDAQSQKIEHLLKNINKQKKEQTNINRCKYKFA